MIFFKIYFFLIIKAMNRKAIGIIYYSCGMWIVDDKKNRSTEEGNE